MDAINPRIKYNEDDISWFEIEDLLKPDPTRAIYVDSIRAKDIIDRQSIINKAVSLSANQVMKSFNEAQSLPSVSLKDYHETWGSNGMTYREYKRAMAKRTKSKGAK